MFGEQFNSLQTQLEIGTVFLYTKLLFVVELSFQIQAEKHFQVVRMKFAVFCKQVKFLSIFFPIEPQISHISTSDKSPPPKKKRFLQAAGDGGGGS